LSLNRKLEITSRIESGENSSVIGLAFGINESTVCMNKRQQQEAYPSWWKHYQAKSY